MSYCRPVDLLRYGVRELAQVASGPDYPIPDALLEATLTGGDRGAYDSTEIDAADRAAAAIDTACADANDELDGYLAGRYALPLSAAPPRLTQIACRVARRNLYTTLVPEEIEKRYQQEMKYLQAVGEGRLNLAGLAEAPTETLSGSPGHFAPDPVFGNGGLEDY